MIRLLTLAVLPLVLVGCGQLPVRVVNLPVPCKISPVEKPESVFATLPDSAGILDYAKALHVDRLRGHQYAKELEAAIQSCQ